MLHTLLIYLKMPFIRFWPLAQPNEHMGAGSLQKVAKIARQQGITKPLLVLDNQLHQTGATHSLLALLNRQQLSHAIFSNFGAEPTFGDVRQAILHFREHQCDGIIAFGGGSAIDGGKAVAASITMNRDPAKLVGLFRLYRPLIPFIAIPTTAGSGSEASAAAIIRHETLPLKQAIISPFLVPIAAVIDPKVHTSMPEHLTIYSGIDALTHAIESYLSLYRSEQTIHWSVAAVETIFEQLIKTVQRPSSISCRLKMANASHQAGLAFTRTYVGYVHAMGHQLSAYYRVPHGLANALLLVPVLRFYQPQIDTKLTQLALAANLIPKQHQKKGAQLFIDMLCALLSQLKLPTRLRCIKGEDIPFMAQQAIIEAHGTYPVPKQMSVEQCIKIYQQIEYQVRGT